MNSRIKNSILLALLIISSPGWAFSVEEQLPDASQEKTAQSVFTDIKCLVCQGESLAESNADLAVDMRKLIRQKIGSGMSGQEVKDYLVEKYGDQILQTPPVNAQTFLLWFGPAALLLIGALFIFRQTKK